MVFTSKMCETHLWKSDILSKDGGYRPTSLLEMSLFGRYFLHILLEYKLTTWFLHNWNIGWKWVKIGM